MIEFTLMYPHFLTSMLASKRTMLTHLESFTRSIHQLSRGLHTTWAPNLYTTVILASLTPIPEEHTKLLDCLSEPSSIFIHHISHPLEEDLSAEVVTSCFICVQVHGFASCIPAFCKKSLSVTTTTEQLSQK